MMIASPPGESNAQIQKVRPLFVKLNRFQCLRSQSIEAMPKAVARIIRPAGMAMVSALRFRCLIDREARRAIRIEAQMQKLALKLPEFSVFVASEEA
jgi:hypothetical protein